MAVSDVVSTLSKLLPSTSGNNSRTSASTIPISEFYPYFEQKKLLSASKKQDKKNWERTKYLANLQTARDVGVATMGNPYLSVLLAGAVLSLGTGIMGWLALNSGSKFISDLFHVNGIKTSWDKMSWLEKLGITAMETMTPGALPVQMGFNLGEAVSQAVSSKLDPAVGTVASNVITKILGTAGAAFLAGPVGIAATAPQLVQALAPVAQTVGEKLPGKKEAQAIWDWLSKYIPSIPKWTLGKRSK